MNATRAQRSTEGRPPADAAAALKAAQVALGNKIRMLREAAGLSQAELAKRVGMVQTKLPAIEQGRRDVRLSTIGRFARALNVSIVELLDHK